MRRARSALASLDGARPRRPSRASQPAPNQRATDTATDIATGDARGDRCTPVQWADELRQDLAGGYSPSTIDRREPCFDGPSRVRTMTERADASSRFRRPDVDPAYAGGDIPRALAAATVMVVRDAPDLHVLMLRRNAGSAFVGGAMVFPGGAVDPDDTTPRSTS